MLIKIIVAKSDLGTRRLLAYAFTKCSYEERSKEIRSIWGSCPQPLHSLINMKLLGILSAKCHNISRFKVLFDSSKSIIVIIVSFLNRRFSIVKGMLQAPQDS